MRAVSVRPVHRLRCGAYVSDCARFVFTSGELSGAHGWRVDTFSGAHVGKLASLIDPVQAEPFDRLADAVRAVQALVRSHDAWLAEQMSVHPGRPELREVPRSDGRGVKLVVCEQLQVELDAWGWRLRPYSQRGEDALLRYGVTADWPTRSHAIRAAMTALRLADQDGVAVPTLPRRALSPR